MIVKKNVVFKYFIFIFSYMYMCERLWVCALEGNARGPDGAGITGVWELPNMSVENHNGVL